ncbi:unnamed protein product [Tetraodon nigroviridis]|uniref:(spotted green pufferfish) hypothetical protein n=1 Tax=Tetraodon nigroviridis TaxID=99883 RepID=Q4SP26_TETNG|nr:unnamed protein product [Tetraodon nigroviridis]
MGLSRAPLFPQEVADQLMHTMAAKGEWGEQKGSHALAANPECRSSLQKLSLDGLRLDWETLVGDAGTRLGFSSLQGLRNLKLANTDLSDAALADVCSLPHLESLDISCSGVSDLRPLLDCKNTLRYLIAHRLQGLDMPPSGLMSVLGQLRALRHLDFSDDLTPEGDGGGEDVNEAVRQLLEGGPDVLPSLVSLDISGQKRISEAAVRSFVEMRSELVFLGLLATGISTSAVLSTKKHLKLVLEVMQSHRSSLHVQVISTACVFKLTTQDLAEATPLRLLAAAVAQLLCAMQTFPNQQQLQMNCLLALCSEYIIQEVPFDKYSAATLVIKWLSSHEDPTLQRIAVAVSCLLVSKQLLAIVQQRAMVGVMDSSLKFALTALWNLTDEMPRAARNFIECRGLELYQEVLENNIAEVQDLQSDLLDEDLLEHILSLMQDARVDMEVRYFAGGVLAQLASRPQAWTLSDELLATIVDQLVRVFSESSQPPGVQLWAVWAIHLVCSHDRKRHKMTNYRFHLLNNSVPHY